MKHMISTSIIAAGLAFIIPAALPPLEGPVPIPVIQYDPTWQCEDCTPEEQYVLAELQERTKITDKNALATLMGLSLIHI